jgi:hypothetical protein
MYAIIFKFSEPKSVIMQWLKENIPDAYPKNAYTAVDSNGRYVWRVALQHGDSRVLLNRRDDAVFFALTWDCHETE